MILQGLSTAEFTSKLSNLSYKLTIVILFAISLQGCAVFSTQSNDELLTDITGSDFIVSVPSAPLNFDIMTGTKNSDHSIMAIVDSKYKDLAMQSGGNLAKSTLSIDTASTKILNSLNKYYAKKYQARFIGKGTIKNVDPDYLNKALKQGDYVIDVRVVDLKLIGNNESELFYLQAAYQLTVVDVQARKNLIKDRCDFAEPEVSQSAEYFALGKGQNISKFLNKYAGECLQYFATGAPLKSQVNQPIEKPSNTTAQKAPKKPVQTSLGDQPYARVGLGGSLTNYADAASDGLSLNGIDFTFTVGKPIKDDTSLIFMAGVTNQQDEGFPTFGDTSVNGSTYGIGAAYHPNGSLSQGYSLMLIGDIAQNRQLQLQISTKAIGLELRAFRPVFGPIIASVHYGFKKHVGLTKSANFLGHEFGVGLEYQFGSK